MTPTPLRPAEREPVVIDGTSLTIEAVIRVARYGHPVLLTTDDDVRERVAASCEFVAHAVAVGEPIYGVTTKYGGMADTAISPREAAAFQNSALWAFKCGAGPTLPLDCVRAAMLLRANSHLHGASGIRLALVERLVTFLNAGVTPHVPELGSIGASGDVVPLNYIAGAILGADDAFTVDDNGETIGSRAALDRLGLAPLGLLPKEGLAMINGTSVTTGIALGCMHDAMVLLAVALGAHALFVQAFRGSNQSFHPFIHQLKPHAGQRWTAGHLLELLDGSRLVLDELGGEHPHRDGDLIQDRYMLRCLPQYLGPVVDELGQIAGQLEIEANSATDNPLIDAEHDVTYHGGNFLAQYVGIGMDRLRFCLGMLAKHLDVQIAWLSSSLFSNGLPDCLVGNQDSSVNLGLKGLQLCGNSIMPLINFLGSPLVDRFPTHAEQFNQNINSQSFGAANLARQSVSLTRRHLAIALMFAVQAVDLRSRRLTGSYDAGPALSAASGRLYDAVRTVVGVPPAGERPYIWDDDQQAMDVHIERIVADLAEAGHIQDAVQPTLDRLVGREPVRFADDREVAAR